MYVFSSATFYMPVFRVFNGEVSNY